MKWVVRTLLVLLFAPFLWLWWVWPPPVWYRWAWPRETAFMAIRQAEAERAGEDAATHYQPVALASIAPILKSAVLAGEDQRFFEHHGIDFIELGKAVGYRRAHFSLWNGADRAELRRALRRAWSRQDGMRGASTITQQLAKNLYLSPSRSPLRKLKEAVTAWRLEYWLGKERILELYLNVAELGPGLWGAEAASQKYFGRPAAKLSLEQAAALAATLPFPLRSNPDYRPGRMRWRQALIIRFLQGEEVEIPPPPDLPDSLPSTLLPPILPDTLILPDTIPIKIDTIRRDSVKRDTVGQADRRTDG
ncbi:MAG: transglycosylase domain-containing protein [Gemmatimonadales bacterium]